MSITIGTIAVMFTIILIGGNVALLFNNMLNNEIEMGYPLIFVMWGSYFTIIKWFRKNINIDMNY